MTRIKDGNQVEFRFYRPGAANVTVSGDFYGSSESELDMHPECDGWWFTEVRIVPGKYRFRYMSDGRWFTDFAAHGIEYGALGWNSLLIVPANPSEEN